MPDEEKIPVYEGKLPPALFRDVELYTVIRGQVSGSVTTQQIEKYQHRKSDTLTDEDWERQEQRSIDKLIRAIQDEGRVVQLQNTTSIAIIADVNITRKERGIVTLNKQKIVPIITLYFEAIAYKKKETPVTP